MRIFRMSPRLAAVAALAFLLSFGSFVFAGTTGALTGRVLLSDGSPVAGAKVTVASPSESASTVTDRQGSFAFISLSPDTYTITVAREGIESQQIAGITVTADNTRTITVSTVSAVKTLGTVTSTANSGLVRAGVTADVYSVNAAMQSKVRALGGGGDLDSAYSAIASVPGVVLSPGQNGWNQAIYIRGGDSYQVGYEFDGIPVLRTYDDYPTTNASTLGQSELQVYTGAAPANSESQGLAGYINQVIKSGSYPGYASADLGIGAPTQYNKINVEAGGATPNRNFSYYVAVGLINQGFRSIDNQNGASLNSTYGSPWDLVPCPNNATDINYVGCYFNSAGAGPGGYYLGPYSIATTSQIIDRENVANFHFGLPHRNDAGKDDIQLLYDVSQLYNQFYSSASDWGLPFLTATGNIGNPQQNFYYYGGYIYTGAVGKPLDLSNVDPITGIPVNTRRYNFPGQPDAYPGNPIPIDKRDANSHGQSLIKLQYQKNFSASEYFRIYGYSYYSDWFQNGFDSYYTNYIGCCSADYELNNHTRGVSATFGDQIDEKHLLTIQGSLMNANDLRMNNHTVGNHSFPIAYLVSSANPMNGVCYDGTGGASTPSNPVSCYSGSVAQVLARDAYNNNVTDPSTLGMCGTSACEWLVTDQGFEGGYNHGQPTFTSASITDQYKPGDQWLFNYGLRYDRFSFKGGDTTGGPTRAFFFRAWNLGNCVGLAPGSQPFAKPGDPSQPCPAGSKPATFTNLPGYVQNYSYVEPRIGGTFEINADNVLRANYGLYVESPSTAYEQYDSLEADLPGYDGPNFYSYGFTTTSHRVAPEQSYNLDFSWEHHFKGTSASFKLTPYLRRTKDQIENFVLEPKTGFISGLNAGHQTADGVEFEISDGDFSHNGFAAQLSYTYTHSYITYDSLANGGTVLDSINLAIGAYNAYTSKCAGVNTARCGGGVDSSGNTPAACYTQGGSPDPSCASGDVANPYWNAPPQPLFDAKSSYLPFDTIPGSFQSGDNSYITPNVASLILNYKHDRFSITPSVQFFSGNYYGAPLETPGIDPAGGCGVLASAISGDPRYPYGAPAGAPYDAVTCNSVLTSAGGLESIPNPYTHVFDQPGAFFSPNQLLGSMQLSYDVNARVTADLNFTNLFSTCFGGTSQAWTVSDRRACYYQSSGYGILTPMGNVYDPGSRSQALLKYPYMPGFGTTSPFGAFLDVKIKL